MMSFPSENGVNEPMAAVLCRLKKEFLQSLDHRILRIEQAWLAASDATHPAAKQASRILLDDVHRISGLAGSLDLSEIGLQAQVLERDLTSLGDMKFDSVVSQVLNERINRFLDLLEQKASLDLTCSP